jgi:hypothetical protein
MHFALCVTYRLMVCDDVFQSFFLLIQLFLMFGVADRANAEIRTLGGIGPIIDCLSPTSSGGEDMETTRAALRTLCNLSIDGVFLAPIY